MRLTRYTDYALRVLIFAGVNADGLCTIDAIADGYRISKNHLRKVVHDLSRHGFIETLQGRKGGIRLSRPPEQINLGAVVRNMEQDLRLVECFDAAPSSCRIQGACALRSVLHDGLNAFLAVLDRNTLADLIRPRHALAERLGLSVVDAPPPTRRRAAARRRAAGA